MSEAVDNRLLEISDRLDRLTAAVANFIFDDNPTAIAGFVESNMDKTSAFGGCGAKLVACTCPKHKFPSLGQTVISQDGTEWIIEAKRIR